MTLSIVIPALNEAASIARSLNALAALRARGTEIVVADGGSDDGTASLAAPLTDRVVTSIRGRAAQMNAGAAAANGSVLLFLHADTRLPEDADRIVARHIGDRRVAWGRFDIAIEGRSAFLPLIAATMNIRSRLTGIATGDQAIFMTRAAFEAAGGFPEIPLMEDVEMTKRLKRLAWPICLRERAATSGRRWDDNGPLRTMLLMWRLRLAYFLGAEPAALARRYGYR
jgi:rSAM/selenodomain-associated transferase 2